MTDTTDTTVTETEATTTEAPTTGGPAELRDALKREKDANAALRDKVLSYEFAAVGLDPNTGLGKAIAKEYDGVLEAEAIAEYAKTEYGWESEAPDNPNQPQIDGGNQRLDQVQDSSTSANPQSLAEIAAKAQAEGNTTLSQNAKAAQIRQRMNR